MNNYPTHEQNHDDPLQSIRDFASTITIESVVGMSETTVAETILEYGNDTEAVIKYAHDKVTSSALALGPQVLEMVRIGQLGADMPGYMANVESHKEWAPFLRDSNAFFSWLRVLKNHNPEMGNELVPALADLVADNYDSANFQAAREDPRNKSQASYAMSKNARALVGDISTGIVDNTDDIVVATKFVESDIMRDCGDLDHKSRLYGHILDLEGGMQNDTAGAFTEILKLVRQNLAEGNSWLSNHSGILAIIKHAPDMIVPLAQEFPQTQPLLFRATLQTIGNKDPDARTPLELASLDSIEAESAKDLADYTQFLCTSQELGMGVTVDQTHKLAELTKYVTANYRQYFNDNRSRSGLHDVENLDAVLKSARTFIGSNLPLEELAGTVGTDPSLVTTSSAKAIIIRRLAANGDVDLAKDLVGRKTTTIDSCAVMTEPIMELLSIYDESGDEAALASADELIAKYNDTWMGNDNTSNHVFDLQKYIAAIRHSNNELALQAASQMSMRHSNGAKWEIDKCLCDSIQTLIDTDDIPSAEELALQLQIVRKDEDANRHHSRDGILTVIKAYVDKGDQGAAVNFANKYLLQPEPNDYNSISAMTYILGGEGFMPSLYDRHIRKVSN